MKENSIEEDIILLNDFAEGNFQRDKLEYYKGSYKMGYFYYKDIQQALDHLLSDYKRALKENEKLKNKLLDILEGQKVIKEETPQYIKENFISVQKIEDKIEEIQKDKDNKYYDMFLEARDIEYMIEVLDELIERGK